MTFRFWPRSLAARTALVLLASDEERTWERKALFFNYANAEVARPQ